MHQVGLGDAASLDTGRQLDLYTVHPGQTLFLSKHTPALMSPCR